VEVVVRLATSSRRGCNESCEGASSSNVILKDRPHVRRSLLSVAERAVSDATLFVNRHTEHLKFAACSVTDEVASESDVVSLINGDTNSSPRSETVVDDLDIV
jgi:hypothetical protein